MRCCSTAADKKDLAFVCDIPSFIFLAQNGRRMKIHIGWWIYNQAF